MVFFFRVTAHGKIEEMSLRQKVDQILKQLRLLPLKVTIPTGVAVFLLVIYIGAFFIDRPVQFSYAGDTCVRQLTLAPSLHKAANESGFSTKTGSVLKIGNVQLVSLQTCFTATKIPEVGVAKVSVAPWGGWFAKKTFALRIAKPPTALAQNLSKPVPTAKPLAINLSSPDTVYDYKLLVDSKKAACPPEEAAVHCDIDSLQLEQGKEYAIKVVRSFDDKLVDTLVSKKITTLPATNIVQASLAPGQVVYERPTSFAFEFDKTVTSASVKLVKIEGDKRTDVKVKAAFDGKKATLSLEKELDRSSDYELTIDKLEAKDGSTLAKPYVAPFKISGGPKIANANIGATGAGLTQTVVLTFDQPLSDTQDITKLASVKGVTATITKKDNQVIVSYAGAGKCVDFSITFAKGLESKYAIAQTEAQSFASRTTCHTVETIGYSKEGRAIQAYFFGNGGQTVLFMGAIHGNEKSSKYIMDSWINDLEAKAKTIPADKQIVVIPVVNPDGFYKYGRKNANGVNLNRNFPTYNWMSDTETSPGVVEKGAGGPSPLSEPETQTLAAFTRRLAPRMVATYHAQGRLVNSNDVGLAATLGPRYASMAGYQYVANHQTTETFGIVVTGTYEDWLLERGTPGILMELNTNTGNHFSQNRAAMWMLVNS